MIIGKPFILKSFPSGNFFICKICLDGKTLSVLTEYFFHLRLSSELLNYTGCL